MARMRDRLEAPVLVGRRRRVRLPRRPRAAGAAWMQRLGLEWAFRLGARAARLWRRYAALQPALRHRVRAPVLRTVARPLASWAMAHDVSVIGLGRVGLPLALLFADRGLRVLGVDKDTERLATRPRGPDAVQGARHRRAARARARGERLELSERAADAAQARRIVLTLGTPRSRTSRSTCATSARCSTTCCRTCARAPAVLRSTVAPGTTEFVAGYLEKHRGFRVGEDVFVAHAPGAHRRRPLHGGDRHAAVHRRRRRRGLGRARGRLFEVLDARSCRPRRCRPSWRRSGRTSCATRRSRCRTC